MKEFDFAYGTQDGCIYQCDLRNYGKPPNCCWKLSNSPVLSMLSVRRPFDGLVIGRQDGTVTFHYENNHQIVHLTGSDCDPIYDLAHSNDNDQFVYTGARDGKVRRYILNYAFE